MGKILKIAYYGDEVLRQKAEPVTELTPEILEFIDDLVATLEVKPAVGLAAPQVHKSLRIFATRFPIDTEDGESVLGESRVFINPKLSNPSSLMEEMEEGCVSIPQVRVLVYRPTKITVEAMNEKGETFTETFEGYNAREVMHENDHLNGTLTIDRMKDKKERNRVEPFLQMIKKNFSGEKLN